MKKPLVSAVLGVYNEQKTLKKTLNSLLNQTYTNFEIIVVDDGSTDSTVDIIEGYQKKDRRIKLLINKINLGLTKTLNIGIKQAHGEYIARMDAGDICDKTRFEKQVKFLEEHDDIAIVGTYQYWIDEKNKVIGKYEFPTDPHKIKDNLFNLFSVAVHPSLMIRNSLLNSIGPYDEKMTTSQEYELFMRTYMKGYQMANIPEYLIKIQRRSEGISVKKNKRILKNMFLVRWRYLPYFLSVRNVVYTVISVTFALLPSKILKIMMSFLINNGQIRKRFLK